MLSPNKKKKLRKILAALDPSQKGELKTEELREEFKSLSLFVDGLNNKITDLKTSLITEFEKKLPKNKKEIITRIEKAVDDGIKQDVLNIQKQLKEISDSETYETLKKEFDDSIQNLKKDVIQRFANLGGGSMNRQIKVGGIDVLKRFTDINFIGAVAAENTATKSVDITFSSSGDVAGPASSTDNAIVRFDGTTGKIIQNSGVTVSDAGDVLLDNSANHTISNDRSASGAGKNLTVQAGGAAVGTYDGLGGDVILKNGISTGGVTSAVQIQTSQIGTVGGLVADGLTITETGGTGVTVGSYNVTGGSGHDAVVHVTAVDGSGVPTAWTVTTIGDAYSVDDTVYIGGDTNYIGFYVTAVTSSADQSYIQTFVARNGNVGIGDNAYALNPTNKLTVSSSDLYGEAFNVLDSNGNSLLRTYVYGNYMNSLDLGGVVDRNDLSMLRMISPAGYNGRYLQLEDSNSAPVGNIYANGLAEMSGGLVSPYGGFSRYTNYLKFSTAFNAGNIGTIPWKKLTAGTTVTANNALAPDQTMTADTITGTTDAAGIRQDFTTTTAGYYTFSVFIRAITLSYIQISIGSVTSSVAVNTTWQRVSVNYQLSATSTQTVTITTGTNTIEVWQAQVDIGGNPGTPIFTYDTPITTPQYGATIPGTLVSFGNAAFGGVNVPAYAIDMFGVINGKEWSLPSPAFAGTATSGGSVNTGTHSWAYTFYNAYGETTISAKSNVKTVSTNKTLPISDILPGPTGTVGRKLYRTKAGDTGSYYLVTTIADNTTTTYTDTAADASLGAAAPSTNTTASLILATGGTTALTINSSQGVSVGALTATSLTDSGLTIGRIPYASTGGLLADSANHYWDNANSRLGLSTTAPSFDLSFGGNATREIWMERHTTSNTAGNGLTIQAGGATSGATNKSGGNLTLSAGTATGSGSSQILLKLAGAGSGGTSDSNPQTVLTVTKNNAIFNQLQSFSSAINGILTVNSVSGYSGYGLSMVNSNSIPLMTVRMGDGTIDTQGSLLLPTGGWGKYGNLVKYSEQFDNAAWYDYYSAGSITVTANAATAPDGNTTADKLYDTSSGNIWAQQITIPSTGTYTFTLYAKAVSTGGNFTYGIIDSTYTEYDYSSAIVSTDWKKLQSSTTLQAGTAYLIIYTTDGPATGGTYLWGAQVVSGSYTANPGIYTRTASSTIAENIGFLTNASALINGNLTVNSLTSTRIPYASTGGLLVDSANLTFSGTNLTVGGTVSAGGYSVGATAGISVTITTAKLTPVTGSNGSMTFTNGILTAQTQAT